MGLIEIKMFKLNIFKIKIFIKVKNIIKNKMILK
jgi:hypothetical protein